MTVRQWSTPQRFSLVQDLLQSLAPELKHPTEPSIDTLAKARGLLSTSQPAPTDAQVAQSIEESRIERCGDTAQMLQRL